MKLFLTFICILFLVACAGKKVFKDEFDTEKSWVEQQTQLPPYPNTENLFSFDIGPISSNQYLIDTTSIKVGQDGVIRFSLVIQSSTGVMNVSYEGIRCETSERKLYALGRDDKTWSQPRFTEWQKLQYVRQFYAQRELAKNYFCPHRYPVKNSEKAIRALEAGKHPHLRR
ncbi:MAG: CNP1-like family protein [Nitrosomonas sp.]|nr:CNP1-like family protein [Nitrosomonas sp.]